MGASPWSQGSGIKLGSPVPSGMSTAECLEPFTDRNGTKGITCNRPKDHKGQPLPYARWHWRWVPIQGGEWVERVYNFEEGCDITNEVVRRAHEPRY